MEDVILKINGRDYDAKFNKDNDAEVNVNDKPYKVEMLKRYGYSTYSFSVNNKLFQVDIEHDKDENIAVGCNGFGYQFGVTNQTREMLKGFIRASGGEGEEGVSLIKSPMPGMVVKIEVSVGDSVGKGDKIIIIEAMKMENALGAPASGVVRAIKVKEGQAVSKDDVLIEIEVE